MAVKTERPTAALPCGDGAAAAAWPDEPPPPPPGATGASEPEAGAGAMEGAAEEWPEAATRMSTFWPMPQWPGKPQRK
ncbi:Os07g0570575 [Oryza sativa Japonica Group]|uniref:Os07g0570575 protein n=1 Tax=Oryza sativa subsp. japonica TaxID=39947 RepID=A0A0P0X860_ORYSJ|nr:hypothetical protein EE612_040148 [Oryza sativa]BAT02228.1 Os07g0570575 [Oryza sativa Japonica Group]